MATSYKTPGVYIEEISKFPPSIAQVETAIPAFVGYTDRVVVDGINYHEEGIIEPIKIKSLPDFEFVFGGAPNPTTIEIELNKEDNTVKKAVVNGVNLLYDSMRMFYANGGGDCYVVSVGKHNKNVSEISKDKLVEGVKSIEKVDQPTLLVVPESVHLTPDNAGVIHTEMLAQCNKLQDRFSVLDIVNGDKEITTSTDPIADFRKYVGMSHLKYGAAYYPWLKTTLSFRIDYDAIVRGTFKKGDDDVTNITALFNSDMVNSIAKVDADITLLKNFTPPNVPQVENRDDLKNFAQQIFDYFKNFHSLTFTDKEDKEDSSKSVHKKQIAPKSNYHDLLKKLFEYNHFSAVDDNGTPLSGWENKFLDPDDFSFFPETFVEPTSTNANNIYSTEDTAAKAAPYFSALLDKFKYVVNNFIDELEAIRKNRTDTLLQIDPVYKGIVNAIKNQGIVLPPSGAIVGLYAMVDNNRGVWKAPANVTIAAVKGPAVNITHEDQGDMNVDTEAGKSVNAIRAFTGKGTMVWGARTLAGNDNEWRYVNVRRFFIMVEESVKKATAQFVFEANDANTWVKVRAMIENFLVLQWRAGALVGAKPDQAFYVRVGLGQTMTAQDVLNGLMNVEIGMAVVRPAEFIVLKFSHKLQES